jgi:hypothetical protein
MLQQSLHPPKTMSPSLVFVSHTRVNTCARRTCSTVPAPGVVTRRSSCSADRRRPPGSSPTGTGPSTGTASRSRFRASSAARSMPTRALDAVTRHRRRRPPSKRAQRATQKLDHPSHRLRGVSIHTLPAHTPSRYPDTHAIEPERTRDGTTSAYLWKPVVLRSPRHRQERWRSQLGARSAPPLHVAAARILAAAADPATDRGERVTGPAGRARRPGRNAPLDRSYPQAGEPQHRPRRAAPR